MSILKQLMEMDPFMRPFGGPVDDVETFHTPDPELVVPDQRYNPLLQTIANRSAQEVDQQEMIDAEDETLDCDDETYDHVCNFVRAHVSPTDDEYQYGASNCGMDVDEFKCMVYNVLRDVLIGMDGNEEEECDEIR